MSLAVGSPSVSASWVVSSTLASLVTLTVTLGPSSAKRTLPPRSTSWLWVAVSPSPSVVVADPVSFTSPAPSTASWSSNGVAVGVGSLAIG